MYEEATSQSYVRPADEDAPERQRACRARLVHVVKEAVSSRLFLMTTLGAATGQIPALAADGLLASPAVVVTVGLTVVAGVGAFLAAIEESTLETERGRRVFTATAVLSILANVAAAGLGVAISQIATFEHMRYFAALALGAIAVEIARGRAIQLPRGVPAPAALIVAGVLVEALV